MEASIFTYSLSHSGYNETSEKYEVDNAGLLQQRNYLLPQSLNHGLLEPWPEVPSLISLQLSRIYVTAPIQYYFWNHEVLRHLTD